MQWDDYARMFVIVKDGAYVKVKPDSREAIVNGKPLRLQVPVVFKGKTAYMSDEFINEVFQSGLDQTFAVEHRAHPLNPLSAAEINAAVAIIKAAPEYKTTCALPKSRCVNRKKPGLAVRARRSRRTAAPAGRHHAARRGTRD